MGMTKAAKLTETQSTVYMRFLALGLGTTDGWVSRYAAQEGKCWDQQMAVLVRKGLLVTRMAPFTMPKGPYAGETADHLFYSIPE